MPPPIQCKAVVEGANQHHGKLVVSELQHQGGSRVAIRGFLGVEFKSPVRFNPGDFHVNVHPWQEVKTEDVTSQELDASTFLVTAKLRFHRGHTFNHSDQLIFGINGDLTQHPDKHIKSFAFGVDDFPDTNGTVNITTAGAPDQAFASHKATIIFQQGSRTFSHRLTLGETVSVKVPAGTFVVSCAELMTQEQTTVSAAHVLPPLLTVETGKTTGAVVSFGTVKKYSAVDVLIGQFHHLWDEEYHVRVTHDGRPLTDFMSPGHHKTSLRRLPAQGTMEVTIDRIVHNNMECIFYKKTETLAARLFTTRFRGSDAVSSPVDTTGFVNLVVDVESNLSLEQDLALRLAGEKYGYSLNIMAKQETTLFSAQVAPGTYTLNNANFIDKGGVLYVADYPKTLSVAADGSTKLHMKLLRGPNLRVKGFPNFMSFGASADLSPKNADEFAAARVSSIFKHAGDKGDGDPDRFLTDDPATRMTIRVAREVEGKLADRSHVLPVMISYTCDLSDGDVYQRLCDVDRLKHSFGNFILSLEMARIATDMEHPVPAGFIVNPNFLGECQKHNLVATYEMPVRVPLQDALHHRGVRVAIPASITDTLAGYVLAVNWLVRTVAPKVTFGWQVNLWGGGSSNWVYKTDEPDNEDPKNEARKAVDYIRQLKVYVDYAPDFLAVDRYEADDWTKRAHENDYFYGPHEWGRFYDFVGHLSMDLSVPVMPWQIPASRAPSVTDHVPADFDHQHWGTGGTYLLGDGNINAKHDHIYPNVLSLKLDPSIIGVDSAIDVWQRGKPFDLSKPAYRDFPLRGIFSVLLGGQATTGVISTVGNAGPWVTRRLSAYRDRPLPLGDDGHWFKDTKAEITECERIVNFDK